MYKLVLIQIYIWIDRYPVLTPAMKKIKQCHIELRLKRWEKRDSDITTIDSNATKDF